MRLDIAVNFRPVPGHPGYLIGDDRSVWTSLEADGAGAHSPWSLIGLSGCTPGEGWNWVRPDVRPGRGAEVVLMSPARRRVRLAVDRLMARAWPPESGASVAAEDDAAPSSPDGDRPPRRFKLTEPKVAEMRRLKAEGWTYPALMGRFGVSRSTVHYALTGATWRHVLPEDEGRPAADPRPSGGPP